MERYETVSKLATGKYASVYLARDTQANGQLVAIKAFQQAHTMPQVLKSAIREATLLRQLNGHPFIVHLHHSFRSESGRVYLIQEYLPRSVTSLMPSGESTLSPDALCAIARQLLLAVRFLHKKKVIHRDLKISSLMLAEDGALKLIDFSLARPDSMKDGRFTPYVSTRWYRAPELLVASAYGVEVDIWAIGCILAELATGRPLFPGRSHVDQLQVVLECFGSLPARFMQACDELFSKGVLTVPEPSECVCLRDRLPEVPEVLFQVIESCLQLDPLDRPGADDLLSLHYFSSPPHPSSTSAQPTYTPVQGVEGLQPGPQHGADGEALIARTSTGSSTVSVQSEGSELLGARVEQLEMLDSDTPVDESSVLPFAVTASDKSFTQIGISRFPGGAGGGWNGSERGAQALDPGEDSGLEGLLLMPSGGGLELPQPRPPAAEQSGMAPRSPMKAPGTPRQQGSGAARRAAASPQKQRVAPLVHSKSVLPSSKAGGEPKQQQPVRMGTEGPRNLGWAVGSGSMAARCERAGDAASLARRQVLDMLESRLMTRQAAAAAGDQVLQEQASPSAQKAGEQLPQPPLPVAAQMQPRPPSTPMPALDDGACGEGTGGGVVNSKGLRVVRMPSSRAAADPTSPVWQASPHARSRATSSLDLDPMSRGIVLELGDRVPDLQRPLKEQGAGSQQLRPSTRRQPRHSSTFSVPLPQQLAATSPKSQRFGWAETKLTARVARVQSFSAAQVKLDWELGAVGALADVSQPPSGSSTPVESQDACVTTRLTVAGLGLAEGHLLHSENSVCTRSGGSFVQQRARDSNSELQRIDTNLTDVGSPPLRRQLMRAAVSFSYEVFTPAPPKFARKSADDVVRGSEAFASTSQVGAGVAPFIAAAPLQQKQLGVTMAAHQGIQRADLAQDVEPEASDLSLLGWRGRSVLRRGLAAFSYAEKPDQTAVRKQLLNDAITRSNKRV